MSVEEIREKIQKFCIEITESNETEKSTLSIPRGATGSGTGQPFENWLQNLLPEIIEYQVFGKFDFAKYVIKNYLNNKSLTSLLKTTWWAAFQQLTPSSVRRIEEGEQPKLQQAFGDIIVKYGDDWNDILLIDVKATEISNGKPTGRPPNIVSAFRLLRFFAGLFDEKAHLIEKVNVWLIGFDYIPVGNGEVRINQAHCKDLFALDLDKTPSINFDAAIQIQWHLRDMVEREDQTLEEFARGLANKYLDDWKAFTNRRDKQIEEIVEKLLAAIKKSHAQKRIT